MVPSPYRHQCRVQPGCTHKRSRGDLEAQVLVSVAAALAESINQLQSSPPPAPVPSSTVSEVSANPQTQLLFILRPHAAGKAPVAVPWRLSAGSPAYAGIANSWNCSAHYEELRHVLHGTNSCVNVSFADMRCRQLECCAHMKRRAMCCMVRAQLATLRCLDTSNRVDVINISSCGLESVH